MTWDGLTLGGFADAGSAGRDSAALRQAGRPPLRFMESLRLARFSGKQLLTRIRRILQSRGMDWLSNPEIWISLLTLTLLEIVLGIDNIVFISILAGKLPEGQQATAGWTEPGAHHAHPAAMRAGVDGEVDRALVPHTGIPFSG